MSLLAISGLLFVAIVSAGRTASADVAQAKAHYERGMALYQLGEYRRALEEFKEAHIEKPDPAFLYNIAQCYRQTGDRSNALVFYKRYLSLAPDSALRPEVEKRIQELEAPPVAATAQPPPTSQPKVRSAIKMEPPAPSGAPETAIATQPPLPRSTPLPRWMPWAGAGITVALAATAAAFGLSANSRFDSLRASCGGAAGGCTQAQIDSVTSRAHTANVLWALTGVAAAGTGITAYVNAREGGVAALWRF